MAVEFLHNSLACFLAAEEIYHQDAELARLVRESPLGNEVNRFVPELRLLSNTVNITRPMGKLPGQRALPTSPLSVGAGVVAHSFALGYSLIGAVASANDANLQGQRSTCLRAVLQASGNLCLNAPPILSEAIPIEEFLAGETIPFLRDEISNRYGERASSAFEMGIWLAVSPLSEQTGRLRALIHVEALAGIVGLDPVYVSRFLNRVRAIPDRFEFATEVTQFTSETVRQLQGL